MRRKLVTLNHTVLFLCTSMYLGTGWSLWLFSFPTAPELTVDNYYMQFVPQVTAATAFFTWMTIVMLVTGGIMVWAEWKTGYRWVPIVVLLGIIAATLLTTSMILPLNEEMAAGITEQARLEEILGTWMSYNRMRVILWTVQWAAMMAFFSLHFLREADPA